MPVENTESKNGWINLITALIGTILYLGLLPFASALLLVSVMAFDSPHSGPEWLQLVILALTACIPLSCLVAVFCMWLGFVHKKISEIGLSYFIPIATTVVVTLLGYLLMLLFAYKA